MMIVDVGDPIIATKHYRNKICSIFWKYWPITVVRPWCHGVFYEKNENIL